MSFESVVQSWYPIATSASLKAGHSRHLEVLGKSLVVFRTLRGTPGIVQRHCAHMGGDLSCGKVTGEGIQCPVHQWEFAPTGEVVGDNVHGLTPALRPQQFSLQCIEINGIIHGYFGDKPAFDIPAPECNVHSTTPVVRDCDFRYDIPSVFGFDTEHFLTVHKRGLDALELYKHHPYHLGTRIVASVDGLNTKDKIMRRLGAANVEIDVDFWAANILFGYHRHSESYVYLCALPLAEHRTRMFVTIMQKERGSGLFSKCLGQLRFQISKPLIRGFIAQDEAAFNNIKFDRHSRHIMADSKIHDWLSHYDTLPRLSDWQYFSS